MCMHIYIYIYIHIGNEVAGGGAARVGPGPKLWAGGASA